MTAAWAPLIPFAKERAGLGEGALGFLLLFVGLGSVLAMPAAGFLAERWGCRAVILIASAAMVASFSSLGFAGSPWVLGACLSLFGAGVGSIDVTINLQAVIVEKERGRRMMSGFHGIYSAGGIIGAGGVSLLLGQGVDPWTCAALAAGFVTIVMIVAAPGLIPFGTSQAGAKLTLPRGIVLVLGLLCFIIFLTDGAVLNWGALFLIASHGVPPNAAGTGYAIYAAAMMIGRLFGDPIVRVLGDARIMAFGGGLAAAGLALATFAQVDLLVWFGFLLFGIGASNMAPVVFSAAGRQTIMQPGVAMAAVTTIGYAGFLCGPAIIGPIAQEWGLTTVFAAVGVSMAAVGAVGWSISSKTTK